MIIDSHCHIYPGKIADKASHTMSQFYDGIPVAYFGSIENLILAKNDAGVNICVVHSVATSPLQVESINRFISKATKEHDCFTGLGTLHPDSTTLESDFALLQELGLKGIKMHADFQNIAINDRKCYKIYEVCDGKMPILMHCGDNRYRLSNPDNVLPVLKDFPNQVFIGAHLGGWSVWDEAIEKLSNCENFFVDTSSTLGFTNPQIFKKYIDSYSEDRVLFGADFPMWRPIDEIAAIKSFNYSLNKLNKIFFQNAAKLYKINL